MFELSDLKHTRVYQEAKQEGFQEGKQITQCEIVRRMVQMGLSMEQISQALDLPVEEVRKLAEESQP